MKEIYLIRHGTTEENKARIIIGNTDPPITDEARAHIKTIKFPIKPDIVYSSPLKRAYETATLLFPGFEIIKEPDVMERYFGAFEGKRIRDNIQALTKEETLVENGGEPLDKLEARILRVIDKLLTVDATRIVAVSHGSLISHMTRVLLNNQNRNPSPRNSHVVCFMLDADGGVSELRYDIDINEI